MPKSILTYYLFVFTFLVNLSEVSAQKKRILVVPFTRFQFVSEFKLEEIAIYNNSSPEKVFDLYQNELANVFSSFNNEKYIFVPISPENYNIYKRYIKYGIAKFDGRKYNGSNLSNFLDDDFSNLLSIESADYILFLNWYSIQKAVHTSFLGDRNKRNKYSLHLIDYDVYNHQKEKILGKGNVTLNCGDFPSPSVIEHKSLNAKEMAVCYKDYFNDLIKELNKIP